MSRPKCVGKRAELNVYDDAMDNCISVDCQNIVYLDKSDVIPADLMNRLIEFEKSFTLDLPTYEKIYEKIKEKLPEECGGLYPIDLEDEA